MSKLLIALGIALATLGLTACESLDKKGYSREPRARSAARWPAARSARRRPAAARSARSAARPSVAWSATRWASATTRKRANRPFSAVVKGALRGALSICASIIRPHGDDAGSEGKRRRARDARRPRRRISPCRAPGSARRRLQPLQRDASGWQAVPAEPLRPALERSDCRAICSRSMPRATCSRATASIEKTAFYIHGRIHVANPRATCVLHTHMPYATALTLLEGGRLEMVEQNALRFHDDIAYDDIYNGLVVDNAEGDRLARALGSKRVMFLANHGVIVVGPTVAEAFDAMYYLERACRLQVLARSMGGKFRPVRPEVVQQDLQTDAAPTRRSTPARTSTRSSASSIARSRPIPVEVAVELRPARRRICRQFNRSTRITCCTAWPPSRRSRRRVEELVRRYRDVIGRGLPYLVAEYGTEVAGYGYCAPYRARSAYRYALEDSIYVRHDMTGTRRRQAAARRAHPALRGSGLPAADRGDRRQRQRGVDRRARGVRLPARRHAALGGIQVRPLGRQRVHAAPAGGGRR